ncbi:Mg2+ and Co2+ transporter CorB, contains DUF21, CBS pair, and CorC-HlyC domains [Formivibrio citricus]|uniref:Mg2+ and Co2+ transporter CorB, contains DUF21, CBS pair, and CorC-HlyC domains n=1 Tax=Formivibrio citricus TaxID=83765 RepID=A0A1I4ZPK1_9NEIS|nr:HlyC/CorC family transporter [Formivibrio citricus]SFN52191.1 Mg2+ and Co2+ transporter CorB, contains DUF21, CBS pair, and CorC-HlyC domains [Formivibrio citricus]
MEDTPLAILFIALVSCLIASGFFSMAETAMMAINRYRLAGRAQSGYGPALRTQQLLRQTDKLLGVILLGNNFINSVSASLATVISFKLAGQNEVALAIATSLVTFAILIFSEATPKNIAARHAEPVAYAASYPLAFLLKLLYPVVWFVNLFVTGLLHLLQLHNGNDKDHALSPEELRLLVLESGHYMEKKHHSILLNLFELSSITVNDVMTPRHMIESIDLNASSEALREALFTCHHTRLPVHCGDPDNIIGILHARKILSMREEGFSADDLREIMRPAYFVPSGTPLFTQLQNFQENRRRLGLIVDEYGELLGLITLEDILEQIIGEFTTSAPTTSARAEIQADGSFLLDGASPLREVNRKFGTHFPLDGPKTLNGLALEHLEEIPDAETCLVIADQRLEIVQTQGRSIRVLRLIPPPES